jgi:hypothetical protein
MERCPACGVEVDSGAADCPSCHLSTTLFTAVRDAAGVDHEHDPRYLRTIGELLATVDGSTPAPPPPEPAHGLLSRPAPPPALLRASPPPSSPTRSVSLIPPIQNLPVLRSGAPFAETRRRLDEYFAVGRRIGLDFTDFEARFGAASLSEDLPSLDVLAREMFVHLASALAEEFETLLARRNELAQLVPTPSVDVELGGVRRALEVGDTLGAQRRLEHVRDELTRVEEDWQVGRILVTECDLLTETLRELGGDPTPATGPLEEGRRCFAAGRRSDAERVLARAAVALWTVLEPRFFEDLRRMRDRMVESRAAGGDVGPAVRELRDVATGLRERNFVATVLAYRRLRGFLDRTAPPEVVGVGDVAAPSFAIGK